MADLSAAIASVSIVQDPTVKSASSKPTSRSSAVALATVLTCANSYAKVTNAVFANVPVKV